ncbi:MAG TPA: GNAT family N-acetyltransferase [Micromonospora sp.]
MQVETLIGTDVLPWVDRLTGLYAVVYAEPPYEEGPEQVDEFARKLPEEAGLPGFTAVVAHRDGELVAVAYGWTMAADTWWFRADQDSPAAVSGAEKFALMEWIVHPDRRGRGHGARVLRTLIEGRPEPWATLAADPRSHARGIYARQGWQQVGTSRLPWGPVMDLLVLPLR